MPRSEKEKLSFSSLDPRLSRTYGFFSVDELESTRNKTVSVAGAGGDGHRYANLVRTFPLARMKAADPEIIEIENANRHAFAGTDTYGMRKVDVFEQAVQRVRPETEVVKFPEGLTHDNVEDFVSGSDLVIDEIDLEHPDLSFRLHRTARDMGVRVMTTLNIGFAGIATSFHPESKWTYERLLGVPENMPLDEIAEQKIGFEKLLPYIPWRYGDIRTLGAIASGAPLASLDTGVDQAAAIGGVEASLHLLKGRKEPTWAPYWRYMDAYDNKSGRIKASKARYYGQAGLAAARSYLGMNPRASYGSIDFDS